MSGASLCVSLEFCRLFDVFDVSFVCACVCASLCSCVIVCVSLMLCVVCVAVCILCVAFVCLSGA